MTRKTTTPVIDAYRSPSGATLIVWCSHCQVDHHHGRHVGGDGCTYDPYKSEHGQHCTCPVGSGDGHRAAHCADMTSPYKRTGYVLRETK